jgi:hypothetical protein
MKNPHHTKILQSTTQKTIEVRTFFHFFHFIDGYFHLLSAHRLSLIWFCVFVSLGYVDNADKLKISPHKFDAAAVAELIIRIMTTHPQQTSTTMPVSLTNNAPGKTDNISKASTSNGAGTGAGRVNRLAQLQNSAAAVRTKTAAGATSDITAPPTIDGAATTTTNRTTATTPSGSGGTNSGSTSSSDGDSGDSGGSGPSTLVRGEAILVFLSGIQAIEQVNKALRQRSIMQKFNAQVRFFLVYRSVYLAIALLAAVVYMLFALSSFFFCRGTLMVVQVYILHGTLGSEQQKRVFRPTSPGEWKIVLATNIGTAVVYVVLSSAHLFYSLSFFIPCFLAETSITVDDVTHVVDSGYVKEMRFDTAGGFASLQEVFISRAAGRQRAGTYYAYCTYYCNGTVWLCCRAVVKWCNMV